MANNQEVEQLLRKPEVQKMAANMPNSTLYYLMNTGDFPKPVKLSKRSIAWKRSEIEAWIQARERAMDSGAEGQPTTPSTPTQHKTNRQGTKQ